MGKGRCVLLFPPSAAAQPGSHLRRLTGSPPPTPAASSVGIPSPARRSSSKVAVYESKSPPPVGSTSPHLSSPAVPRSQLSAPRLPPEEPEELSCAAEEAHQSARHPAQESASGTGTGPCLPGTSASSPRTCRRTRACTPPADHAAHNHAD